MRDTPVLFPAFPFSVEFSTRRDEISIIPRGVPFPANRVFPGIQFQNLPAVSESHMSSPVRLRTSGIGREIHRPSQFESLQAQDRA